MEEGRQEKKETKQDQPYKNCPGIHPSGLGLTGVIIIIILAFALTSAIPMVKDLIFGEDEYEFDEDEAMFIPVHLNGYQYLGTEEGQVHLLHLESMQEVYLPSDRVIYRSGDGENVLLDCYGTEDEIREMFRNARS